LPEKVPIEFFVDIDNILFPQDDLSLGMFKILKLEIINYVIKKKISITVQIIKSY
jgi:hypothetical protein